MANEFTLAGLNSGNNPYSVEAEQSILGSVIIDPETINKVVTKLKPAHFYLPQHAKIYEALLSMYDSNARIDFVTLFEKLKSDNILEEVGGKQYLTELAEVVPASSNIDIYVDIVIDRYLARSLLDAAQKIVAEVNDGGKADVLIDSAEQKIYDIRSGRENGELVPLKTVIKSETYDRLQKVSDPETRSDYLGIRCGLNELDETLTGFNKGELIILGARPGIGKTSLALNIARNIAIDEHKKVCFFCLEMTRDQLATRLLSSEAGIPSDHLRDSMKMTDNEWVALAQASETLSSANILLDETADITVPQIKAKVRRAGNVDFVVIDYLGLIRGASKHENRVQEVSEISRSLKVMAKELNIPMLVCAQLNRGVETKGGIKSAARPTLSDLRDSGSIEQDADVVMFLHQNKTENEETAESSVNSTELIIAKNRHGERKTIYLNFDGRFTRFTAQDNLHFED